MSKTRFTEILIIILTSILGVIVNNIFKEATLLISIIVALIIIAVISLIEIKNVKVKSILQKFWKYITAIGIIAGIITIKECSDNNKEYSIVYHQNGGIGATENVYTKGSNTIFLPTESMKKDGYTFAGWYDNENYDGNTIKNIPKGGSGDKFFWAKWELLIYTIRFETNGGRNVNDTIYTIESETITLREPKAFNKKDKFVGWFDNEKYSGNSITDVQKGSKGNKVFWARWEGKIPPQNISDTTSNKSSKDSNTDTSYSITDTKDLITITKDLVTVTIGIIDANATNDENAINDYDIKKTDIFIDDKPAKITSIDKGNNMITVSVSKGSHEFEIRNPNCNCSLETENITKDKQRIFINCHKK